jgi:hypothetical protein
MRVLKSDSDVDASVFQQPIDDGEVAVRRSESDGLVVAWPTDRRACLAAVGV